MCLAAGKLHRFSQRRRCELRKLVSNLLRVFPESRELFEYGDYALHPTMEKASSFISAALDTNVERLQTGDGYMQYIATRPKVERRGDHGLFGVNSNVDLNSAISELESRTGNVWTVIYSLRREDAARLGYDNAASWRDLLIKHQQTLSEASRIPLKDLRWYAAFHDTDTHPHIHLMFWSSGENDGYLSNDGVMKLRSSMTNDIFQNDMLELYQRKDVSYKEVTEAAKARMTALTAQMQNQLDANPALEQRMVELAEQLESVKGKKQYGYLKKPLKQLVDDLVDELARDPAVAQCYAAWNEIRDELESYYKTTKREHLPLSQQKEFRAIKNLIIREADRLRSGELTYEESWSDGSYSESGYAVYRKAKLLLQTAATQEQTQQAVDQMTEAAKRGSDWAQYTLGSGPAGGTGPVPWPFLAAAVCHTGQRLCPAGAGTQRHTGENPRAALHPASVPPHEPHIPRPDAPQRQPQAYSDGLQTPSGAAGKTPGRRSQDRRS